MRLFSFTKPKISTLLGAAREPMAAAQFPCSGIVSPPAARGENEGGTLMGGLLPHMVPHSAVCALHLIAVALGLGALGSHSPSPISLFFFYINNVEVQEETANTSNLHHRFIQNSCFLMHHHRFSLSIDQAILIITLFIHLLMRAAFSISNRVFYLLTNSVK